MTSVQVFLVGLAVTVYLSGVILLVAMVQPWPVGVPLLGVWTSAGAALLHWWSCR
jgi:hypothetical protein